MNTLTTGGSNAIAALSGLKQGLQNVATAIVSTGGDPYLRLMKDGIWVYGQENVEVEDKSEWAVNPLSIQHGWVAWSDYEKKTNEVIGQVMVPANTPLPSRVALQDVVDDEGNKGNWQQQISMQFQCMSGEDVGTQVLYKATSVGGMNASKGLLEAILNQLDKDIDNPVPLVLLKSDSYTHKKYGKTYVPEFDVVEWVPLDDAIKAPVADTPDSDVKADAKTVEAQQVRTRGVPAEKAQPADDMTRAYTREELDAAKNGTSITADDRKAAIDAALADAASERATRRAAAPAEEAGPRRRQRR